MSSRNSRTLLWIAVALGTAIVLYTLAFMDPPAERPASSADGSHEPAGLEPSRAEPPPAVARATGGAPAADAGLPLEQTPLAADPNAPPPVDVLPPTSPDAWKPNAPPPQRGTDLVFSNTDDRSKKKDSAAPAPPAEPSPSPEHAEPPAADVLPPTRYDTPETVPKVEPNRDTGLRFSTKPAEGDKP